MKITSQKGYQNDKFLKKTRSLMPFLNHKLPRSTTTKKVFQFGVLPIFYFCTKKFTVFYLLPDFSWGKVYSYFTYIWSEK